MADQHLGTGESLSAELIAQRGFTTNRKGFDPAEVRAFLSSVADTVRDLREQIRAAEAARRAAEERAAHPKVDEDTLLAAMGEETASILRSARSAAADIKAKAEEQAAALLRDAQTQAEITKAEAEADGERVRAAARQEAEATRAAAAEEIGGLRGIAEAEAEEILTSARDAAETTRREADEDRRATIEGAQRVREQILGDLTTRRRTANTQVEQLLAGRTRLLEAYTVVRQTLDEVTNELEIVESQARQAADEAARRVAREPDLELPPLDQLERLASEKRPTGPLPAVAASGPDQPTAQHQVVTVDDEEEDGDASAGTGGEEPAPSGGPSATSGEDEGSGTPGGASSPPSASSGDGGTGDAADKDSSPTLEAPVASGPTTPTPSGSTSTEAGPASQPVGTAPGAQIASAGADQARTTAQVVEVPDEVESVRLVPAGAGGTASGVGVVALVETEAVPAGRAELQPDDETDTEAGAAADAGTDVHEAPVPGGAAQNGTPKNGSPASEPAAPAVEGIFARIRAERAEALDKAREVLADPEPAKDAAAPEGEPEGARPATAGAEEATAGAEEATAGAQKATAGAQKATEEEAVPDGDEGILQRRDEGTADIEVALTRRIKRALQDEQNDLLDRLRHVRGTPKAGSLLPKPADQRGRYTGAAREHLDQAASAGIAFAGSFRPAGTKVAPPNVDDLAVALAAAITDPLRRRLQQAFGEHAGDEQQVLIEALGSAYRETKTQRVEQLAGDHVAAAFSRGVFIGTPDGTALRWLVDDVAGPCPDCDDNVLAGEVTKGDEFPTGQVHPPAHAGCRCILVPTD